MKLNQKSLEKLQKLINEEIEYKSGPQLVHFFNSLGFNDVYGQGFPSRWVYTLDRLNQINGTPKLEICIKTLFSPINFIGKFDILNNFITDFNQYLNFDGWKIIAKGKEIIIVKSDFVEPENVNSNDFMNKNFGDIDITKLMIEPMLIPVIEQRINEIKNCIASGSPLSAILLCGSTLEGILMGIAQKNPKDFNTATSAPKKDGKVKQFYEWTLSNFIDTAHELNIIDLDVKKFSSVLRDFRNYIHPYEQFANKFNPTMETAKICVQVLKAGIYQIIQNQT